MYSGGEVEWLFAPIGPLLAEEVHGIFPDGSCSQLVHTVGWCHAIQCHLASHPRAAIAEGDLTATTQLTNCLHEDSVVGLVKVERQRGDG